MKLIKHPVEFEESPWLTQAIDEDAVAELSLKDFDKDGYEVPAPLERAYYEAAGVQLDCDIQYHVAPVKPWYTDDEDSESGLVLDHAMIMCRRGFAGAAREQLEQHLSERPILRKLLNIRPKWGIDFSLDYVGEDAVMEVFHIEQDFDSLREANAAKHKLESIIDSTDWQQGVRDLIDRKSKWQHLSSDDHSDYKARFFGWHRAFDNLKVFK